MLEALIAALGTTAGKAAAGLAIASASVGGLAATEVVELPDLSDEPAEVTTEGEPAEPELPAEAQAGQDAAEDGRQEGEAGEGDLEIEEIDTEEGVPNDNATFGQDIAEKATTGTTGQDLAEYARENNPGAAHRADAGAPENAGERQDATVRQDDGAGQDDAAPRGGEVADEHTPERETPAQAGEPGSQADERSGGAAAAGARS